MDNKLKRDKESTVRKKERELGIINMEEEDVVITTVSCPFCSSRKSKRIRSFYAYADEDEVNIMECLVCKNRFREGSGVSGY